MAKNNPDISYMPKLKGDRGKLRDKDKYRDNYDKIFKKQGGIDDGTGSNDRKEGM